MAGNSYKEVQTWIGTFVESILPGGGNLEMYQKIFANMSDAEFKLYMTEVDRRGYLDIVVPVMTKSKLSTERNIAIARKLGHEFFERLIIRDKNGTTMSNIKYMILQLPVRRQAQHSIKGISTSENNLKLDQLTGQATGDSKSAKLSYTEIQLLNGMNLPVTLFETIKGRGGDIGMFNAMKSMASKTGVISMASIADHATGVEATKTLNVFLTCAHLRNNA